MEAMYIGRRKGLTLMKEKEWFLYLLLFEPAA